MKNKFILFVLLVGLFIAPTANADNTAEEPRPFHHTEDAMADIDNVLAKAKAEDKLAIIVLGANWCHDSLGLAQRFQSNEMVGLIAENYELLYVDIGFFEVNMNLVSRFGLPIMFGTPTVLVVDPETETLLNRDTMHKWLDAASVSLEDTKDHFTDLLNADAVSITAEQSEQFEQSDQLKALLGEIALYEAEQTARITSGYAIVGPKLRLRVSGEGDNEEFMFYWGQLSKMRYGLAGALIELRSEAIRRDASGEENIELDYPNYPPLTWE